MEFVIFLLLAFCGAQRVHGTSIASLAAENQFPYMVSLQQKSFASTPTRGHRCGGVLVRYQFALTLATCVYDDRSGHLQVINPPEYRVFAGSANLTNDDSADHVRDILFLNVHPSFEPGKSEHNLVILTLASPFLNTTDYLQIATQVLFPMDTCVSSGWGSQTVNEKASTQLTYANKTLIADNVCGQSYDSNLLNITVNMVCTAAEQESTSGCSGFEGNPLVCKGFVAGLLFKSPGCSNTPQPEVYLRLFHYYGWVAYIVNEPIPDPEKNNAASVFLPRMIMSMTLVVFQILHVL